MKTCSICGKDISHLHFNSKMCPECSAIKLGNLDKAIKVNPSLLETMRENIDYVQCVICGHYARNLIPHLKSAHHLSPKNYDGDIFCKTLLKEKSSNFSGKNNPGYDHNGRLSPFSKKSGRTKEQIIESKRRAKESIQKSDVINTKFSYWLKKANGDAVVAEFLYHQRQATFSLDSCVRRYGEENGKRIWKERQIRWMNSLNNKSQNEIEAFHRSKLRTSKEEQELFEILKTDIPDLESQFYLSDEKHHYFFDIRHRNRLIEFCGDFWHGNPKIYRHDDIVRNFRGKAVTAQFLWKQDQEKYEFARKKGFEILQIWENDFINDKESIIENCKQFLCY